MTPLPRRPGSLLLFFLLAGCGGDDRLRLEQTASCLRASGLTAQRVPATEFTLGLGEEGIVGGPLSAQNGYVVFFERDEQAAARTQARYPSVVREFSLRPIAAGTVRRFGVGVLAYTTVPTPAERRLVESCLSDAR